jgi:Nucleotide-sugar transporter
VRTQGFLGGYTPIVWTVIIVQAVGGLIVATVVKVCYSMLASTVPPVAQSGISLKALTNAYICSLSRAVCRQCTEGLCDIIFDHNLVYYFGFFV